MRRTGKIGTIFLGAALLSMGTAAAGASAAPDTGWTASAKLYEVHTWAGQAEWGSDNGALQKATLFRPRSLAELPDGRLLVADTGNHLLRALTADSVSAFGGSILSYDESGMPVGAYSDGTIRDAFFNEPAGLTVDATGNIFVADASNNAIRKISASGQVTTLAGNGLIGTADGKGSDARFYYPSDVAVNASGDVYVADTLNNAIRKIAADGTVTTLTAPSERVVQYLPGAVETSGDYSDGPIASAKFNEPSGLVLDKKGNLYVSDRGNNVIRYVDFAAGTVTTVAGSKPVYASDSLYADGGYSDGTALAAKFDAPEGLAIAPDGTLVIADSLNHAIRLLKDGKVSTLAGEGTEFGSNDGVAYAAHFDHPTDVVVLSDGRLAIADEGGNKVRVLEKYGTPSGFKPDATIQILLNGELVKSDVPAFARHGMTLLPLRSLGEALGYEVSYEAGTKTAKLSKDGIVYEIREGISKVEMTSDGRTTAINLPGAPGSLEGRLFVPVRFFAEQAGLDTAWDSSSSVVVLRSPIFQ
ncbi:stalk domain-containing protein [Cohnella sp. AR92]|uniref:stalk domain-containing protein n=1 Tax=Cohnella sp. AR92 TaxID=648716 RepID=UPI000F8D5A1C|nr:stalk domain-containing protein [Cohnella sp. AR92]RUS49175.1 copper amine oxidase [Cohnella sp. AR92]